MKNSVTKNEVPFISSFDAHVSYCLLVAIGIERKYGRVNSHYQQQCFIDGWGRCEQVPDMRSESPRVN